MDPAKLARPAAFVREALAGFLVHCPHAEAPEKKQLETKKPKLDLEGEKASCGWSGRHEFVERHLKEDCVLTICKCKLCERKMPVLEIEAHTNEDCPRRLIPCAYCAKLLFAENVKLHEDNCNASPHAILECLCGAKVERQALDNHMETTRGHLQLLASRNRSLETEVASLRTMKTQFDQMQARIESQLGTATHHVVRRPISAPNGSESKAFSLGGIEVLLWMYNSSPNIPMFSLYWRSKEGPVISVIISCFVNGVSIVDRLQICSEKASKGPPLKRLTAFPTIEDGNYVVDVIFVEHK